MTIHTLVSLTIYEHGQPNSSLYSKNLIPLSEVHNLFKKIKTKFSDDIIIPYILTLSKKTINSLGLDLNISEARDRYAISIKVYNTLCIVYPKEKVVMWFI